MTDAVGLAVNIAGLETMAGKIVKACREYVGPAHEAPKALRSVLLEYRRFKQHWTMWGFDGVI